MLKTNMVAHPLLVLHAMGVGDTFEEEQQWHAITTDHLEILVDGNDVRSVWDSIALLYEWLLYCLEALVDLDAAPLKVLREALIKPWDLPKLIWKLRRGFW
jgi:hypothetical protein